MTTLAVIVSVGLGIDLILAYVFWCRIGTVRVTLTEADFRALVAGLAVRRERAQIALQDIGFYSMRRAVLDAERNTP